MSSWPEGAAPVEVRVPLEGQRLECVEGLVELGDDVVEAAGLRRWHDVEEQVELEAHPEQRLHDPVAECDEDVVGPVLVDAFRERGTPDLAASRLARLTDAHDRAHPGLGGHRAQRHLDPQLRAVGVTGPQLQSRAHGPGRGVLLVAGPVVAVDRPHPLGQQHLDGMPHQLLAGVPEEVLEAAVGVQDAARLVGHRDAVGRQFEHDLGEVLAQRGEGGSVHGDSSFRAEAPGVSGCAPPATGDPWGA